MKAKHHLFSIGGIARAFLPLSLILSALAATASAAGFYRVIDLGPAGGVNAINNVNQVVGTVTVGANYRAQLWTVAADGSVVGQSLHAEIVKVATLAAHDNSIAYGINDAGQFAGCANDGATSTDRAVFGAPIAGGYSVLDLKAQTGQNFRRAYDVNNAGTLVGYFDQSGPYDPWPKAVAVNTSTLAWTALNMGVHPHTLPYDISEGGHIVGYCEANPRYLAASWENAAAPIVELSPVILPGSSNSSWAFAVNENRQAVGMSRGAAIGSNTDYAATLWNTTAAGSPVNLDPANVFPQSRAYDVNNAAQVVGMGDRNVYTLPTRNYRAILWEQSSGILDLNDRIGTLNWTLQIAASINEAGWIAGTGTLDGQTHAFVLVPDPDPVFDWEGGNAANPQSWDLAANWNPQALPDGPGVDVSFGRQSAANAIVNLPSAGCKVGTIAFFAATGTTIQSTGGHSLTLDNGGAASTIDVAGSHVISAPVVLMNDVLIAGGGNLALSGGVSGNHAMMVLGNLTASRIQVNSLAIGAAAAAVPEPSAMALFNIGVVVSLAFAWRKRMVGSSYRR